MRMWITAAAAALTLVGGMAGTAHGLSLGRMETPPELATAERVKISGVGFGRRGRIEVSDHTGSFDRSSNRANVLGSVFETRRGGVRYDVTGPLVADGATAECGMRRRSVNLGAIEVGTVPLTFQCVFAQGGRPLEARLEVQENEGFTGILAREERQGRAAFGPVEFRIRSVHRMQRSPMSTEKPMGYLFERDGLAIGGVETNGGPFVLYGPNLSPDERRAVLLAALALGLWWDPAGEP